MEPPKGRLRAYAVLVLWIIAGVLFTLGVHHNWGDGWALIAAGLSAFGIGWALA